MRALLCTMLDDLRFGWRILFKNPGFAVLTILIMALGIGANTAVFSVVNAMLLRPIPGVADPGHIAAVYRLQRNDVFDNLSFPDYADFRDGNRSFSGLAAHTPVSLTLNYGTPERLRADLVTGNYFGVLGVTPAAGRLLTDDGNRGVAVVSYGVWQRKFGGNPGIAGARVALNGRPFTVIGVAAEKFRGTETGYPVDVWAPIGDAGQLNTRLSSGILQDRAAGWIWMFGRLMPGVRIEAAQAEMKTIASQLARAYSVTNEARSVNLAQGLGMYPDDRAEITGLLGLLSGAVALLLLIACGNVASLFMIRASLRTREMAVRLAIGAGPGRLIRQLLAEGLVLATIAGAMGLLIAQWATTAVVSLSESTSRLHRIDTSVDARVLVFTLLTCAITGLLFALALRPALEVHEGYLAIGRRIIPWMDIRRLDRSGWISPLVVRVTLFDDSRFMLVYPGDLDACNSLLRHLRRLSRDALIDGIPYRQYWGEVLSSGGEKKQPPPPPRYRILLAEDEAEVERLYQRLKTVGNLDQKNADEK